MNALRMSGVKKYFIVFLPAIIFLFALPISAAVDDHGDTYQSATPVLIDTETSGNIEDYSDVDFFRFSAAEDMVYTITVTLESLEDSWLILYSTDGMTQITFNDDNSDALSSEIEWTCPEAGDGTYYASVAGYDYYDTGRYTVLITEEEPPEESDGCFVAAASYEKTKPAKLLRRIIEIINLLI